MTIDYSKFGRIWNTEIPVKRASMSKPPYFGWQHLCIWGDSESKLNQIMGHTIKRAHEANMESEAVVKLELNLDIQMIHHKTFMRSDTSQVSLSWLRYICPGLSSSSSTKKSQMSSSATCQCNIEWVTHFSDLHPLLSHIYEIAEKSRQQHLEGDVKNVSYSFPMQITSP